MRGLATIPTRTRGSLRPPLTPSPRRAGLGDRARRPRPSPDPVLVTKEVAARILGMSISHFQRHVQSEIKCVYSGQLTLYHYGDLKRWAEDEATIGGRDIR